MEISTNNFFEDTLANFTRIAKTKIPNRKPDFVSNSGSQYWYVGNSVIRLSNHWGRGIASCNWYLNGKSCNQLRAGICNLTDFMHQYTMLSKADGFTYTYTNGAITYKLNLATATLTKVA